MRESPRNDRGEVNTVTWGDEPHSTTLTPRNWRRSYGDRALPGFPRLDARSAAYVGGRPKIREVWEPLLRYGVQSLRLGLSPDRILRRVALFFHTALLFPFT